MLDALMCSRVVDGAGRLQTLRKHNLFRNYGAKINKILHN